jgi:LacI family transcriptional regulator
MKLRNPPDAVFCGNDTTALSALEYCQENNLQVPDDIALVGFSDEPFSAVVTPSLSTVKQPGYQMGYQAALKIIHRIENYNSSIPFEQIILQTQLIIRDSSK